MVVVGTPIGNLGDLSPRALLALEGADVILCEDTRRTRALLSHAGVKGKSLVSLEAHREETGIPSVLRLLESGKRLVMVSDAGMPGISDPGTRTVAAAIEAGYALDVVPGPNAAVAALVLSGFDTSRFCFEGFLPRSGAERRRRLYDIARQARTVVIYESPFRLAGTLEELAGLCGAERRVVVAREMTKVFQEVWRGSLAEAVSWAAEKKHRGEVVVVLEGSRARADRSAGQSFSEGLEEALTHELETALSGGVGVRNAAKEAARRLGVPARHAYERALELIRESGKYREP